MRFRPIILVSTWLLAGAAGAQTGAPAPSSSVRPNLELQSVPATPIDYRLGSPQVSSEGKSPFRFTDGNRGGVANQPPPRAMDRDNVFGNDRAWVGGRPPLNCAVTPMDAKCR